MAARAPTRTGSTSSSTSPVSRTRRPSTSPSRTIETSLIPRPESGGSRGTVRGSGQSTSNRMSSTASRSPVTSVPRPRRAGAVERRRPRAVARARVRASRARRPARRDTARAAARGPRRGPRAGWVRTRTSSRRSHGGSRRSSSTRSRSGSGPPSTSIRPPRATLDEDRVALADVEHRDPRRRRRGDGRRRGRGPSSRPRRRSRRPARGPELRPRRPRRGRRSALGRPARVDSPRGPRAAPAPDRRPVVAPPRTPAMPRRRDRRGRAFHGGSIVARRERQRGRRLDDADDHRQQEPGGQAEERRDQRRARRERRQPTDERHRARCHRRRDQRHDAEVDDRRDDRQPAERQQDDRQRRRLGDERDGEALDEPAGQPTGPRAKPRPERRRPRQDPGGRERRELEPGIGDEPRVDEQQDHRRPAERRRGPTRPAALARDQDHAGHRRRSDDRRRRAGERDVDDDRGRPSRAARRRRDSRPHSAATQAATIAMFQPEIATTWLAPTVVKSAARSRSTRSRRPMTIPDARPASGSGIAAASAAAAWRRSCSRRLRRVVAARQHLERARPERPGDAGPAEVVAVAALGRRPDRAVDATRSPGSIAGKRGSVAATATAGVRPRAAAWPPGCRRAARRQTRPARPTGRSPRATAAAPAAGAGRTARRIASAPAPIATRRAARPPRRRRARPSRPPRGSRRRGRPAGRSRPGAASAATTDADREPAAGRHQRTVTRSRSFSNVAAPTTLRSRSSSTLANGCLGARVDDLLRRHRTDARQRVQLGCVRGVEVDEPADSARLRHLRPPPLRLPASGSPRAGTTIRSPSATGAARFSSAAARAASTRGPYPPAAAIASPTRDRRAAAGRRVGRPRPGRRRRPRRRQHRIRRAGPVRRSPTPPAADLDRSDGPVAASTNAASRPGRPPRPSPTTSRAFSQPPARVEGVASAIGTRRRRSASSRTRHGAADLSMALRGGQRRTWRRGVADMRTPR